MARRAWRPGQKRWRILPPYEAAANLARRLATSPLVAQLLYNRGIRDAETARCFLKPKLADLHEPHRLEGIPEAARRIARAVAEREKIVIYGDYDVDGITAVAILHACLRMVGGEVDFYVPHRLDEGYGVNAEAIDRIAAAGAGLIVTVDCGIGAAGPIARAVDRGVDVIVTDHHAPGEQLPPATVTVHPALGEPAYPNPDLAGAGVAYKLAWQVAVEVCGRRKVDDPMRRFLLDATCLAALGTIADVVPLTGENRVLARYGLEGLPGTEHPGLRALLDSAGLGDGSLDAYDVGFKLAPRLNACGRMGHARLAVELLTDPAPDRARRIAEYLTRQNAQRQKVERAVTAEAVERVGGGDDAADVLVLASDTWHGGVIGIVASRLVERYGRPAILVAFNGEGIGQGSGRSIPGFDLRDALAACAEHLESFGGHAMAGGVKVRPENLDAFTGAINAYARRRLGGRERTPELVVDAEAALSDLSYKAVEHMTRLAPFGQGNPSPALALPGCRVLTPPRRIGKGGGSATLTVGQSGTTLRAVGFGMGDLADCLRGVRQVDLVAEPVLNRFRGRTQVELKLLDARWE